jgi:hypothetical protein
MIPELRLFLRAFHLSDSVDFQLAYVASKTRDERNAPSGQSLTEKVGTEIFFGG